MGAPDVDRATTAAASSGGPSAGAPSPGGWDEAALAELFDASPDLGVRVSAAAVAGFVLGLGSVATALFSLTLGLSVGLAALGLLVSVVGLARASRPVVAGGSLAGAGAVLSLAAGSLFGLGFLGIDATVGDGLLDSLRGALTALNDLLPPR